MICALDPVFSNEDVYAAVGSRVTIQCHQKTVIKSVMWHYRKFGKSADVFDGQFLVNGYVNKSTISNSTYDLTILEVEVADAGEYLCTEDEGFGDRHITKLIVTGMYHCCFMAVTRERSQTHCTLKFRPCYILRPHLAIIFCLDSFFECSPRRSSNRTQPDFATEL